LNNENPGECLELEREIIGSLAIKKDRERQEANEKSLRNLNNITKDIQ